MATTRIWKIVKRLDHVVDYAADENKTKNIEFRNFEMIVDDLNDVINYAMNKDKTEKQFYVTGLNCEPESAYEEMMNVKDFFHKEDGILGFHAYQSFKEKVSP